MSVAKKVEIWFHYSPRGKAWDPRDPATKRFKDSIAWRDKPFLVRFAFSESVRVCHDTFFFSSLNNSLSLSHDCLQRKTPEAKI